VIYWHLCPGAPCAVEGSAHPDFLSASEIETYAGLRFPKRRHEWLLGRWTAKQLLQRSIEAYCDLPLPAISVAADPDGAPYLAVKGEGRLPVSLSISHRAGRAFCALSPAISPSIGVDLEQIEPRSAAFVRDFFTAGEAARVWDCPESDRDTLVTVIWSAKEAMLKALREGLRLDTRLVEIGPVAGIERTPLAAATGGAALSPWAMKRAGGGASEEHWHPLEITCPVPGVLRFAAWWRRDNDSVLTAAAVWP
jgi:4'-phosphopantetheinyl transferase